MPCWHELVSFFSVVFFLVACANGSDSGATTDASADAGVEDDNGVPLGDTSNPDTGSADDDVAETEDTVALEEANVVECDPGCKFDQICVDGECVIPCQIDDDCGSGSSSCTEDGEALSININTCVEGFCQMVETVTDCPEGKVCHGGDCLAPCQSDDDCEVHACTEDGKQLSSSPLACVEGVCFADTVTVTDCPKGQHCAGIGCTDICTVNNDCPEAAAYCYCSDDDSAVLCNVSKCFSDLNSGLGYCTGTSDEVACGSNETCTGGLSGEAKCAAADQGEVQITGCLSETDTIFVSAEEPIIGCSYVIAAPEQDLVLDDLVLNQIGTATIPGGVTLYGIGTDTVMTSFVIDGKVYFKNLNIKLFKGQTKTLYLLSEEAFPASQVGKTVQFSIDTEETELIGTVTGTKLDVPEFSTDLLTIIQPPIKVVVEVMQPSLTGGVHDMVKISLFAPELSPIGKEFTLNTMPFGLFASGWDISAATFALQDVEGLLANTASFTSATEVGEYNATFEHFTKTFTDVGVVWIEVAIDSLEAGAVASFLIGDFEVQDENGDNWPVSTAPGQEDGPQTVTLTN